MTALRTDTVLADLVHPGSALVDAATGTTWSGSDLLARAERFAEGLVNLGPGPLFLLAGVDTGTVERYLGGLAARRPVALLDPATPHAVLADLIGRFQPAAVLGTPDGERAPEGYLPTADGWRRLASGEAPPPHPDLTLLLGTSGSTGSPKFVRLSGRAVLANARSVIASLGITTAEIAPTCLPLHYSYGLSVLHSHLAAGATVVVTGHGVLERPFWTAVDRYGITSLAGVPYHYEMLRRLRFDPAAHPSLRTVTQAGGRLRDELVTYFHRTMAAVGGRMFVMYGQTEAAPRMACLPAEELPGRVGSVGRPVPGGTFTIRSLSDQDTAGGAPAPRRGRSATSTSPGAEGEVVYQGPNVMMGYAESAAELSSGDELGGVLATGDLGYLDEEGFLFLTGRLSRIGKVFGNRVNLDDVERLLRGRTGHVGPGAAVADGDRVVVFLEGGTVEACRAVARTLAAELRLHASGFDVRPVDRLPLLPSGKTDYRTLEAGT
ncbi:AMP-dependent acyl-CoA synthetase [Actinoalloteichus sp. AHMU CJ021]|uniref:Acyl-CoA synthetase (AMP-forming)/AMP-acid ligase II n=1 Tax=Actinoalloteichus caeruleus DSM 43889 TaxID=1120930 RepID=A0ABT1JM69_ACTCY|nr:AMP-binding protein [Actinoalloteichus caeruleus]AUS78675.1 AMP-dependent acyl-CoA synthetase [Actinoalloteichus sp. AHMU CJ021]MCP2332816.1 Acyl-CoA synthetase (AMP-forming)/AMP-acid ligase II [Actinoalloteichus caeruleus DSM 43889]